MFEVRSQTGVTTTASVTASGEARGGDGKSSAASRKQLAAELRSVDAALSRLRERVSDLHSVQLDQEEGSSVLANRVGALEQASAAAAVPDPALALRVDVMAGQFQAVRVETASLSNGVAELEQRVLNALSNSEMQQRRIDALEQGGQDTVHSGVFKQRIGDLRDAFGPRIAALEQGLQTTQSRVGQQFDQRLRRIGTALGLLGIGLAALTCTVWWQAAQRADSMDTRLDGLTAKLDRAVDGGAADLSAAVATLGDGLAGLERRVEQFGRQPPVGPDVLPSRASSDADAELRVGPVNPPMGVPTVDVESGPARVPKIATEGAVPASQEMAANVASSDAEPLAVGSEVSVPVQAAWGPASEGGPQPSTTQRRALLLEASRWMVQLIGFRGLASVREFAARQGIAGDAWTIRGTYRGRPWYSVLVGDYADQAVASAAIDRMPSELRALRPIVRLIEPGARLEPVDGD